MKTLNPSHVKDAKLLNQEEHDRIPYSAYTVFLLLIVDLLGFTVILPLLPSIFDYYASNKEDHLYYWMDGKVHYFQDFFGSPDVFNKVLFAGILGSIFSSLQFLVSPIFGALSDVYGRKPVLLLSMVGIAISHILWCFADTFYMFVLARIVGGLSRANTSLATAIMTDICPEKKRGKGMALIGIAFAVGFILGPIIGAIFASSSRGEEHHGFLLPALFSLFTAVLDILLIVIFFKETLPKDKRASSVGQGFSEVYQYINPLSLFSFTAVQDIQPREKESLRRIGLIYFIFLFIYSGLEYSLSFLTHLRFKFTSMQQGKMYLFSGLIMILVQGGYTRRIPPGKELTSAAVGAVLIIPAFVLVGLSSSLPVLYMGLALYAVASASVVPCLTTVASKSGSISQKGTVLGIFRSLGYLARAIGPLISAMAYWSVGPSVSYCVGALLLSIPLVLILQLNRHLHPIAKND